MKWRTILHAYMDYVSVILTALFIVNNISAVTIQTEPLVINSINNANDPTPIQLGHRPMAKILYPKHNEFVTDFMLDLQVHFDVSHPLAKRVTDVCVGLRMLRGKNGKSEDILSCDNNIRNFRREVSRIKSKLEGIDIELPFRGEYILELAMFHQSDILYNIIHNFTYGIVGSCENILKKRQNNILPNHHRYTNIHEQRDILQMHPLCYDWYGSNFNNLANIDTMSSASAFRGSFGVDYAAHRQGNGDVAMLNFILVRHPNIVDIVELGTFAGMTSLQLGIAMSLRDNGRFHTFDVQDYRPANVKKVFHNMKDTMTFHISDFVNSRPLEVTGKVSKADLLFIDTAFDSQNGKALAIEYGKVMKVGSILVVSDCPGKNNNLNEWMNEMAKIAFVYIYHDVVVNHKVVSSLGIFQKYNSEDEAKVKLCETPFLNCKKTENSQQYGLSSRL